MFFAVRCVRTCVHLRACSRSKCTRCALIGQRTAKNTHKCRKLLAARTISANVRKTRTLSFSALPHRMRACTHFVDYLIYCTCVWFRGRTKTHRTQYTERARFAHSRKNERTKIFERNKLLNAHERNEITAVRPLLCANSLVALQIIVCVLRVFVSSLSSSACSIKTEMQQLIWWSFRWPRPTVV